MKNVLIVANFAPIYGGNFIQSLKALETSGQVNIRYLFPVQARNNDWIKDLGPTYFTDWSKSSLNFFWGGLKAEYPVDVVHFHFINGVIGYRCKLVFGSKCNYMWHFHNHAVVSTGKLAFLKNAIKSWIYGNSYKIGVSESVSESVRKLSSKNVYTLYNAIDFNRLEKVGEESGISKDSETIKCMMMGSHFVRKGVDLAAKAVSQIYHDEIKIELYISVNDDLRNALIDYLNDILGTKNWNPYIKLLHPRNDIASFYNKMDIFLSPSREEGFTYSVAEAAYCGCQVILSKCPGQDEYLKHNIPSFYWVDDPKNTDIVFSLMKVMSI
jgi:glycosyltransferase involved in cell wall biosynthesis